MKRIASIFAFCLVLLSASSATKVYINPGHGSWGSNCRPMATINYAAGDTLGFFESNTNLWKSLILEEKLLGAGYSVKMSRRASGGDKNDPTYNKALSTISSEANNYGTDYFISIHSNAGPEGVLGGENKDFANYPVLIYKGTTGSPSVKNSDKMSKASIARLYEAFWAKPATPNGGGGPEPTTYYSASNPRIVGDYTFYGYHLGVLKNNSCQGFLSEGYFHTYSPARHRALNPDWCREEGVRYFRGIQDYYGKSGESVGYIMGYVRSKTEKFSHKYYIPYTGSNDEYKPINGAKVVLRNAANEVIKANCYHHVKRFLKDQDYYTTDHNYNGVFVFENLEPGKYTISVHANGYKDYEGTVTVTADKTTYPEIFLEKGQGTEPNINVDIKWVLNGGIIPGGDVPSNENLWETFKTDFNNYYGKNRADQAITNVAVFWPSGIDSDNDNILTNANSTYKWLGDYIQSVAGTPNGELWWRANLHAFFNCLAAYKLGDVTAADFSTAGKPEAWGEAYQIAMGTSATLPSSVKETYVIPTPKKDGDVFVGWYEDPKGEGTKITSIPAGYKGTIYAIWENSNPDSDEATHIITWVLNGGKVLGGDVPSNENLMEDFKNGYNTYFSQSIATTREFSNFLYYGNTQGCDISKMLTDTKSDWLWLGDYLQEVSSAAGAPISTEVNWRYSTVAFFTCAAAATYNADFTQAGKPEAWGDAYRVAYGLTGDLPTKVTETFVLPIPVKDGYVFMGWFDNPEGTGTAITSIPAGWYGTLYAIWKINSGTDVDHLSTKTNSVQKIMQNGQILILRDGKIYNIMGQMQD